MQIGEVIRKYRKNKGMTQEEMANRLGVSAPAVNKWENGNSFPDIMLLAPIARLLDITADTLLSFREEITGEEINRVIYELDFKLKNEDYEESFQWAKDIVEKYPNCEQLIWQIAVVLDANRMFKDIAEKDKYESHINKWYIRALESKDEDIRTAAADSLFAFYVRKEDYQKAEEYLIYFSKQNPERKRKQALLYGKMGRREEAYKAYEEILLSGCQMANVVFYSLYSFAMQEKDIEKAGMLVEKQSQLAAVFEMGEYSANLGRLELAVAEKDVDLVINIAEKMISSVYKMGEWTDSFLYEHMSFKTIDEQFILQVRENLLQDFRNNEEYAFLKDDKRWQKLVN